MAKSKFLSMYANIMGQQRRLPDQNFTKWASRLSVNNFFSTSQLETTKLFLHYTLTGTDNTMTNPADNTMTNPTDNTMTNPTE